MSELLKRLNKLSRDRLLLLAAKLQQRVSELEAAGPEPIAIVGLGCRLPGGISTPDEFWQLLEAGGDAVTEVPPDRWDIDQYYDPDPDAPGKMNTRWGGFLDDVAGFDPDFFGIAKREANSMDPQQRLLLEVAWEALENAGENPAGLKGSRTGVFAGICNNDYYELLKGDQKLIDAYLATGSAHSVASGRIAYVLGLEGPAVSVDTACSSSLVAFHLACQSLANGECDRALAAGVNLILIPEITITLSKAHMMSPEGRCKAFDASARGFVRGEGAAVAVLKRLSDAQADGDPVLAVVRGSASNQDGRSHGLTAPNGPSQENVIRDALKAAGLKPHQVGYVEAHGTGTELGDPIEARALSHVFGDRQDHPPLLVGSVKSNLGHLESAAGIVGLIKAVLAIRHGVVPRSLHYSQLNPHIEWDESQVRVSAQATPWPDSGGPRVAGISSFGFSGSNAHVIVAEAPSETGAVGTTSPAAAKKADQQIPLVMNLSARDPQALKALATRHQAWLDLHPDLSLADIAHTLNTGRNRFSHHAAVVADSLTQYRDALAAVSQGQSHARVFTGRTGHNEPDLVWAFGAVDGCSSETGQAQLNQQIDTLAGCHQDFAAAAAEVKAAAEPLLAGGGSPWARPLIQHVTLQLGLARMFDSWGLRPARVFGYGSGELIAAVVAGIMSVSQALRLLLAREPQQADWRYVAVTGADAELLAVIDSESGVRLEAVNAPDHLVVLATPNGLAALETAMTGSRAQIWPLTRLAPPRMWDATADATFEAPAIGLISGINGEEDRQRVSQPDYWQQQATSPVRYDQVLAALGNAHSVVLEIGSQGSLAAMGRYHTALDAPNLSFLTALAHVEDTEDPGNYPGNYPGNRPGNHPGNDDPVLQIQRALAALCVRGIHPDWTALGQQAGRRRVALPAYPFQRERCWAARSGGQAGSFQTNPMGQPPLHPLLGQRLDSPALNGQVFTHHVRADQPRWLSDHQVAGSVIMPSPAYLEMALAAAGQLAGAAPHPALRISQFSVIDALPVGPGGLTIQIVLEPAGSGWSFAVHARDVDQLTPWKQVARGAVAPVIEADAVNTLDIAAIEARCGEPRNQQDYYRQIASLGLDFGEAFQGVKHIQQGTRESFARVSLAAAELAALADYQVHPALLDACFHALGGAVPEDLADHAYLLIGIDQLDVVGQLPGEVLVHSTLTHAGNPELLSASMTIMDNAGRILAQASGLHLKRANSAALARIGDAGQQAFQNQDVSQNAGEISYVLGWEPRQVGSIGQLPDPCTVIEETRPVLEAAGLKAGVPDHVAALNSLDQLCGRFVFDALIQLGWQPIKAQPFGVQQLADSLGIAATQQPLLASLLAMLTEDGLLQYQNGHWSAVSDYSRDHTHEHTGDQDSDEAHYADRETLESNALAVAQQCPSEHALTLRCGAGLAEVLTGRVDPVSLLFPGGDFSATEALYQNSPYARASNQGMAHAIKALVQHAGGGLKVLEIGAGTGGTTGSLLAELAGHQSEYVFSDLSPLFLSRAREKFADYDFVDYQLLDISADPLQQGFESAGFDVIVAANVLHATASLDETLDHVASLLKPGGVLLLLEGHRSQRWVTLTFGLTEGWWLYKDPDNRHQGPLADLPQWQELLAQRGLSAAGAGPGGALDAHGGAYQSVIVARRQARKTQPWLLVGPDEGRPETLSLAVADSLGSCHWVSPDDLQALGAKALPPGVTGWAGVLLWAPGCVPDQANCTGAAGAVASCHTFVTIAQLLSREPSLAKAQLFVCTHGGQPIKTPGTDPSSINPAQAPLWGMGRVYALEQPARWGGLIDLDPARAADTQASALVSLMSVVSQGVSGEDQWALRDGQTLVPRLTPRALPTSAPLQLSSEACYLVTGGLGGLGQDLARWLCEHGAGEVVLTTRRELGAQGAVQQHQAEGGAAASQSLPPDVSELLGRYPQIQVATADVTDAETVARLFSQVGGRGKPVKGVFHCAVAMSGAAVDQLETHQLKDMLGAKIDGCINLHQAASEQPLDFMVLFSSSTALIGVAGLAHYAAANQFLDSFAHQRSSQGLPTLSVNWGTWETMRLASDEDQQAFSQAGMMPLATEQALAAMAALMVGGVRQRMIARVDWPTLKSVYQARRPKPMLSNLASIAPDPAPGSSLTQAVNPVGMGAVGSELRGASRQQVEARLTALVRQTLALSPSQTVDPDRGLFDMGLDSLMAVEFKSQLESWLGTELPATVMFNYPNISSLAEYLLEQVKAVDADQDRLLAPPQAEAAAQPSRFHALSGAAAVAALRSHVAGLCAEILGRECLTDEQLTRGLFDMGMDSLMAVELKSQLEQALGLELPATLIFNHPSVEALAVFLADELATVRGAAETGPSDESQPDPEDEQDLDSLSEEALADLLRGKLDDS